jgi:hypothetical protein
VVHGLVLEAVLEDRLSKPSIKRLGPPTEIEHHAALLDRGIVFGRSAQVG